MNTRKTNQIKRAQRSRTKMHGTAQCPRLTVNKSLRYIEVQIIDDDGGKSLGGFTTKSKKYEKAEAKEKIDMLAKEISTFLTKKNIKKLIFDRSGHPYKGQIALLADAIRKNGVTI